MGAVLGAASVAVSWLFVYLTYAQYRDRRGLHHLSWTIGAAFFALGLTAEVVARRQGAWSPGGYRLWYYAGAMQGVAFLGQGTLHLLDRRAWTQRALEVLVILALISLVIVVNAPLDLAQLATPSEPSGRAFQEIAAAGWNTPRAWTIPFNVYGSLFLIGGAALSTARLWRTNRARAVGTLGIAAGGLILASTSTLNRFGIVGLEELGRITGLVVLLAGFSLTGADARTVRLPRLPSVPATTVFAATGWLLAIAAFFRLEPRAWTAVVEYPGLVIIALAVVGLGGAVILKARDRSRRGT